MTGRIQHTRRPLILLDQVLTVALYLGVEHMEEYMTNKLHVTKVFMAAIMPFTYLTPSFYKDTTTFNQLIDTIICVQNHTIAVQITGPSILLTNIVLYRAVCTPAVYMYTYTINGGDLFAVDLVYGGKVKGETIHLHFIINPKSTCFCSAITFFTKQDKVVCYI